MRLKIEIQAPRQLYHKTLHQQPAIITVFTSRFVARLIGARGGAACAAAAAAAVVLLA